MIGPDFMDELDCGSFFDHIDDLFVDFSGEDVDAAAGGGGGALAAVNPDACSFPSIWSNQSDSVHNSESVFSGHSASGDLSAELSVPYEDIVHLEWLSNFVEDSFSGGESLTMNKEQQQQQQDSSSSSLNKNSNNNNNLSHHHQFQTSSPISVLESSSSCSGTGEKCTGSGGPRSPETVTPGGGGRRGRARSKRPRPATFNPRPAIQLISPTSSFVPTQPKSSSDSENFAESRPIIKIPKQVPVEKKKKKIKLTFPVAPAEGNPNGPAAMAVRKCMHCEITKTPQWRAGPMGPKTLCNACGVRFKSGRLFPEYRPAASPTFVPALHSNSHKKVLEMRGNGFDKSGFSGARSSAASALTIATASTAVPELVPNNNGISMGYA